MTDNMNAANNIQCARCGDRYGWFGRYEDCPNCPHCGEMPDSAVIAETAAKLEEARSKVIEILKRKQQ